MNWSINCLSLKKTVTIVFIDNEYAIYTNLVLFNFTFCIICTLFTYSQSVMLVNQNNDEILPV